EHEVVGEQRREGLAVLVHDRLGHPVHCCHVRVLAHRCLLPSCGCGPYRTRRGRPSTSGKPWKSQPGASVFLWTATTDINQPFARCAGLRLIRTVRPIAPAREGIDMTSAQDVTVTDIST